jgi:co-chaperonin GroES (HSP10)
MALNYKTINGNLVPIRDHVIVSDMFFGEQKTKGGLIIKDDDGTTRGIYPRWGKVHRKGPENTEEYSVGDWVLVEHGRWTRAVEIDEGSGPKELRMIETSSILGWSKTKPNDVVFGKEYENGAGVDIRPEDFINR